MICEKCGTANAPGATFCIGCGQNLPVDPQQQPAPAPAPAAPPADQGAGGPPPPPAWGQQPPPPPPGWGPAPPGQQPPPPGWGQQPPPWGQQQQQPPPPPGWGQPVAPAGYYPPGYAPGYGGYVQPVKNNMAMAIIAIVAGFLCGCLGVIPGVVAIVFASQVNGKAQMGDITGATRSAKLARTWSIVAYVVVALSIVAWVALIAVGNSGNNA